MQKLTIQFSDNKRFPKKKLSIYEGMMLLSSEEQKIQAAKSYETVTISIEGSRVITEGFIGQIPLGKGDGEELLSYLEVELCRLYPENKREVTEFVEELAEAYSENRNNHLLKPDLKENGYLNKRKTSKYLFIGIAIFVIIAVISVFSLKAMMTPSEKSPTVISSEKYLKSDSDSDMKKNIEAYSISELGKKFPKDHTLIARLLAEEKEFEKLQQFQKLYPTEEGAFYIAFHEKNWKKVIETPSSTLTKENQIMLVHAYVELGKLSEAEILNGKLKSKQLSDEIFQAYKRKGILLIQQGKISEAEPIQKKINDQELGELIETGKTCQEMIDFYKKEKDVENQNVWLKRLENLGGELLTNDSNE